MNDSERIAALEVRVATLERTIVVLSEAINVTHNETLPTFPEMQNGRYPIR